MTFPRMCKEVSYLLPKIYGNIFNKELYRGTLPKKIFVEYLVQDSFYLADFSRALRLTSSRLKNFPNGVNAQRVTHLLQFAEKVGRSEREMHYKYLNGIPAQSLFSLKKLYVKKNPVVSDYTKHILNAAEHLPLEVAVASLIPCFWIYSHHLDKMMGSIALDAKSPIACSMDNQALPLHKVIKLNSQVASQSNPYHSWIASYSSPKFIEATQAIIEVMEELGGKISCPLRNNEIVSAFVESVKYEILFWDSVYYDKTEQRQSFALQRGCRL